MTCDPFDRDPSGKEECSAQTPLISYAFQLGGGNATSEEREACVTSAGASVPACSRTNPAPSWRVMERDRQRRSTAHRHRFHPEERNQRPAASCFIDPWLVDQPLTVPPPEGSGIPSQPSTGWGPRNRRPFRRRLARSSPICETWNQGMEARRRWLLRRPCFPRPIPRSLPPPSRQPCEDSPQLPRCLVPATANLFPHQVGDHEILENPTLPDAARFGDQPIQLRGDAVRMNVALQIGFRNVR